MESGKIWTVPIIIIGVGTLAGLIASLYQFPSALWEGSNRSSTDSATSSSATTLVNTENEAVLGDPGIITDTEVAVISPFSDGTLVLPGPSQKIENLGRENLKLGRTSTKTYIPYAEYELSAIPDGAKIRRVALQFLLLKDQAATKSCKVVCRAVAVVNANDDDPQKNDYDTMYLKVDTYPQPYVEDIDLSGQFGRITTLELDQTAIDDLTTALKDPFKQFALGLRPFSGSEEVLEIQTMFASDELGWMKLIVEYEKPQS